MEWTLCHRCLSDFRTAGKDLRRVSHVHTLDWCDFCSHRMGYTYREVQRGRQIADARNDADRIAHAANRPAVATVANEGRRR